MWEIIGDFSEIQAGNSKTKLKHKIEYDVSNKANQDTKITRVTLLQDKDNSFRLGLIFISKTKLKEFLSICKSLNTLFNKSITTAYGVHSNLLMSTSTFDKTRILNSLQKMVEFDEHIILILNDIGNKLGIEIDLGLTIEKLLAMPVTEAIDAVVKIQSHMPNLIWQLAQAYSADSLLPIQKYNLGSQTIYDLLTAISPENPNYRAAQDAIVGLLMRVGRGDDAASDLQLKFIHSINGTEQSTTDRLFDEICGYSIGQSGLSNIKPDVDTLLQLANEIKRLNNQLLAKKASEPSMNPQSLFYFQAPQPPTEMPQQENINVLK